jgi:hypothetical protein
MNRAKVFEWLRNMARNRMVWAGLVAGVIGHILQGMMAFLFFDRYYLAHAELLRDVGNAVGIYYLIPNLIIGLVLAYLSVHFKKISPRPDWQIGGWVGALVWAASAAVVIIKRQIIFDLSNWLLLEMISDLVIFAFMGSIAGLLSGRSILDHKKASAE